MTVKAELEQMNQYRFGVHIYSKDGNGYIGAAYFDLDELYCFEYEEDIRRLRFSLNDGSNFFFYVDELTFREGVVA